MCDERFTYYLISRRAVRKEREGKDNDKSKQKRKGAHEYVEGI